MAKGFASARDAFAEIEARKNSGGGGGFFFKLPNAGDSAVVRFVDQEPSWAWVHELPKKDGASYGKTEVCRDQDPETGARNGEACPGCDEDYKRKMSGTVRLIWRNAPVYETVKDGDRERKNYDKVVGNEDQVAKWTVGKVVLEELDGKAATYKDLTARDFRVTRRGSGLSTTYDIEPLVDDNGDPVKEPMSAGDRKLVEEAGDQPEYKAPAFELWGKQTSSGSTHSSAPASADVQPFRARATA